MHDRNPSPSHARRGARGLLPLRREEYSEADVGMCKSRTGERRAWIAATDDPVSDRSRLPEPASPSRPLLKADLLRGRVGISRVGATIGVLKRPSGNRPAPCARALACTQPSGSRGLVLSRASSPATMPSIIAAWSAGAAWRIGGGLIRRCRRQRRSASRQLRRPHPRRAAPRCARRRHVTSSSHGAPGGADFNSAVPVGHGAGVVAALVLGERQIELRSRGSSVSRPIGALERGFSFGRDLTSGRLGQGLALGG